MLRTAAVGRADAQWFKGHGFGVAQRLVVLRRGLDETASLRHCSPAVGVAVSSHTFARRWLRHADYAMGDALATLDATGFGTDWRLSFDSLLHACRSTPTHRIFIAHCGGVNNSVPTGFVVVGAAYDTAYLQRLVVSPEHRGRRIATTLVIAGITWARTNGARRMLVNTEPNNAAALALYRSLDFVTDADGLAVLERDESDVT